MMDLFPLEGKSLVQKEQGEGQISERADFQNEIVIGLSPNEKGGRGLLLPVFAAYETFLTAFLYAGWSIAGIPYMAVGRNLAYTKSFFSRAVGFSSIQSRLSGDDDLLINKLVDDVIQVNQRTGMKFTKKLMDILGILDMVDLTSEYQLRSLLHQRLNQQELNQQ